MRDELSLLKEIGTDEDAPVELEARLRRQLLERTPPKTGRAWFASARIRIGVAVAAAACAVAAILISGRGSEPSVAARAYAAVTARTGIAHFVTQYPPSAHEHQSQYQEYWVDLANPRRKRIVFSTGGGGRVGQLVYLDHRAPRMSTYRTAYPNTTILESPRHPAPSYPGGPTEKDPLVVYRQLLKSGYVVSEKEITYRGRPAYELELWFKPPYQLVGNVWTGDRETYIVDRKTYFPLETRFRLDPAMGGSLFVTHYLKFEILPASPRTTALLNPVKHPQAYRP